MAQAVLMPKLGNTVESSVIVRWLKAVGDTVAQGEAICEIETDKATIEVESSAGGTVLALFFAAGDDVPVMTPIAAVGAAGEDVSALSPAGATTAPAPVSAVGSDVRPISNGAHVGAQRAAPLQPAISDSNSGTPRVSPRARKLAARSGLALDGLMGTGPGGRVIERDVQAALEAQPRLSPVARTMLASGAYVLPEQGTGPRGRITKRDLVQTNGESAAGTQGIAPDLPTPSQTEGVDVLPVRGVRKLIASRMLQSLQTTAQLTLNASADARALQAYRSRLKGSDAALGLQKVTINHLILFAVARVLVDFRDLNALFKDEAIHQYHDVHLGFAVDTPRGLLVPVIRRANTLSLRALAGEATRLAEACAAGKITPGDMEGGTFTVTNLGSFGIESFTPVLNPPQVAILGVGSIQLKPVEDDGAVAFVPHIGLSLTIDHQVVDGAPGARFLKALAARLADFETLLAL
jgi:pyruvate dehydrogenase E2 component (dihydrolipoamide acetyltransferase)